MNLFTLTKDCDYEEHSLNKGDIVLLVPVPADDDSVIEGFKEHEEEYESLISVYVYDRETLFDTLENDEWIFSREPKYATFVDSDYLPDLFADLSLAVEDIELPVYEF